MRRGSKFLLLGLIVTAALIAGAASTDTTKAKPAGAVAGKAEYVGTETCLGCHEDQQKRFKTTVMGKVFAHPRTDAEKLGCESCHGPGKAHVDGGGDKAQIVRFGKNSNRSIEEQNAACISCHNRGKQMFWRGSSHESRGMACVSCHVVKAAKKASLLAETRFQENVGNEHEFTKPNQIELCLDCHNLQRARLQRSSHMPYREGKMTCTSCHNPHGTANPKQLEEPTVSDNCLKCHAERRGPFLWEHAPVTESCTTCHDAHGTTNPQLLKVRQPRLCNSCHITARHPTQPQTLNSRVYNRGCTNCHPQIHGSNHPSGNMFTR